MRKRSFLGMVLLAASLGAGLFCGNAFAAVSQEDLIRQTAYGPVAGTTEGEALVWFGIPYGKEPTGELRWQAPQDPDTWTEVFDATTVKEKAMQLSGTEIIGTEDCLNLDIYAPEDAEGLPVLVYIHGGNNQTGTTRELIGSEMVVKDEFVFVSLNYRLGLLGFNCLPALQTQSADTGNYALLDIAKALDWVKENIAAFGGNPDNITISGFSAGGRDVMALLISPLFEGKFDKAISFSGGMTVADETLSAKKIAQAIAPYAVEDGKASTQEGAAQWLLGTGEEVKAYLYSLSGEKLSALMGNAGIRMSVFPHLYTDGVALPAEGFDTENYNEVPLIMLTGTTEFSMFAAGDSNYTAEGFASLTEEELAATKEFAITYGSQMYQYFNAEASAEKMYAHYNAPIYLCSINYGAPDSPYPVDLFGAFHGIFVPMLASENGYTSFMSEAVTEPAFIDAADNFNRYLKNFLYTGDPNGDGLVAWSSWEPTTHLSIRIDGKDHQADISCVSLTKNYAAIMDEMDADTSISSEAKALAISNVLNGRWFSQALDERYGNADLWE